MGLITKLPLATEKKLSELFDEMRNEDYVMNSLKSLGQKDPKLAEIFVKFSLFTRKNPDVFVGTGLFIYDGLSRDGPLPITSESIVPHMQDKIKRRIINGVENDIQEIGTLIHNENPVLEKYLVTICENARNLDIDAGYDALFGGLFVYDHLRTQVEVNRKFLN